MNGVPGALFHRGILIHLLFDEEAAIEALALRVVQVNRRGSEVVVEPNINLKDLIGLLLELQ